MEDQGLLLDMSGGAVPCWYCGSEQGPWEREHQRPVSRGGGAGTNIVRACASCNHLKGKLTLDEFREALASRLGVPEVVFWGEASNERAATSIRTVRSLQGDREVTRLDPVVSDRLDRAVRYLRRAGQPRITRKDIASTAVDELLDRYAAELLGEGEDFPESVDPQLFEMDRRPIFRPGEASRTPKEPMSREVTRIDGALLDQLRLAVDVLREHEHHETTLTELVNEATRRLLADLGTRYPQLLPLP